MGGAASTGRVAAPGRLVTDGAEERQNAKVAKDAKVAKKTKINSIRFVGGAQGGGFSPQAFPWRPWPLGVLGVSPNAIPRITEAAPPHHPTV